METGLPGGAARCAVTGAIAGLAASYVMGLFQSLWSKAPRALSGGTEKQSGGSSEDEPATVKAAEAIVRRVSGRELWPEQKVVAGSIAHYVFGSASGALYGALAESRMVRVGRGAGFGFALWVGADEVAVPALKLSKPPTEYPISVHAYSLASHILYGLTLDAALRAISWMTCSNDARSGRCVSISRERYGTRAARADAREAALSPSGTFA